ncbi:flavodoxin [Mailhella sp.]|uniref:flavodoxin n=1 Tax=Mailhella sp. TaxID=1981029 RepID=UPI003AB6F751
MKILIVYGSTTGNTAGIAEALGERIGAAGHEVTVLNAADASAEGLCDGYDAALFGCSAWGTDEVELQDDFNVLFENFDAIGVSGKKAACFASGDSNFEHFCGAVDVLENRLVGLGAVIVEEGLKVDGDYAGNKDEVDAWCGRVLAAL